MRSTQNYRWSYVKVSNVQHTMTRANCSNKYVCTYYVTHSESLEGDIFYYVLKLFDNSERFNLYSTTLIFTRWILYFTIEVSNSEISNNDIGYNQDSKL